MKAVEFLRVSTQEQGDDTRAGIPRQKEANAQTIIRHGLTIVKTIQIIDVSGTSVLKAPEVQELIQLVNQPYIKGIVVADWDRLIRLDNFRDFALLQYLKESDTLVFLPDQVIDLNTQSGFLIGGFQSIISGNELTQIKKRMLNAKEIKRKNGEHPNNKLSLPTGVDYDYQTRKFRYTDKVRDVQRLFDLFVNGNIHNYKELERLTGIHHRTIYNLLRNEIYTGYRAYTQKRGPEKVVKADGRQGDRKKVKRAPAETIRVKVIDTPAVDEQTFRKAQDIINRKNRDYHAKKSRPGMRFLYTGFLTCGICGEKIYSTSGGRNHKKDYYYCRTKNYQWKKSKSAADSAPETVCDCRSGYMQKEVVECTITSFVSQQLTDTAYLKQLIHAALSNQQGADSVKDIANLEKRIAEIRKKRSRILDLYADGIFTRAELDSKADRLNTEMAALTARLKDAKDTIRNQGLFTAETTITAIATALSEFEFWTPPQKRSYLQSQIPDISITKDGITAFTLNFCEPRTRTGRGSWRQPA